MTLTKAQIVESIQNKIGFPRNKSYEVLETFLEIIKSTLQSDEDVMTSGFSKFCVKKKRNEKAGIQLPVMP